jgi:hypothetical protein
LLAEAARLTAHCRKGSIRPTLHQASDVHATGPIGHRHQLSPAIGALAQVYRNLFTGVALLPSVVSFERDVIVGNIYLLRRPNVSLDTNEVGNILCLTPF